MELHVHRDMLPKALGFLRGAPGPSDQAIDVRPEHGAGVVQRKERVEGLFLQLPLPADAAPTPGMPHMV